MFKTFLDYLSTPPVPVPSPASTSSTMPAKMQHVDTTALDSDLTARIAYLSSFLELTAEDVKALLAAKPLIAPLVPAILEKVYVKLLSFDITAQA
jgi:hypothetical protein